MSSPGDAHAGVSRSVPAGGTVKPPTAAPGGYLCHLPQAMGVHNEPLRRLQVHLYWFAAGRSPGERWGECVSLVSCPLIFPL